MKNYQYYLVLIDDMMPKEYDDMTEEERIKSCSTKLFQKFNDINVPVVIMVTKNKKRLEKKYLDYDFDFAIEALKIFMTTKFDGGRHLRRINKY